MKIAISYHLPLENDIPGNWNSSSGFADAMRKRGHDVKIYPIRNPHKIDMTSLIDESSQHDLILFFFCGPWNTFDSELKKLYSHTSTPVFMDIGDEPQTYSCNQVRINHVDAFFTADLRCHNYYLQRGLPSNWMTHWCDDAIFYYKPHSLRTNKCITTCGQRPCADVLSQVFGERFVNKRIWNHDNTDFYNSGTVVFQFANHDEITRRIMEGGGCRNAVIQNRISAETGIYELFQEDVDMCYYSSVQECVDKVHRLLEDDEYRTTLSTNLYNKITKYHMVGNRVDQVLEVYNSITKG
jgi:hypothetical protein